VFYAFMAKRKIEQLKSYAQYIDSRESWHFTNKKDCFIDYIACSSKDWVIFNGGEEYTIVGKGNVQISFGGKILIFLNVYYVSGLEKSIIN